MDANSSKLVHHWCACSRECFGSCWDWDISDKGFCFDRTYTVRFGINPPLCLWSIIIIYSHKSTTAASLDGLGLVSRPTHIPLFFLTSQDPSPHPSPPHPAMLRHRTLCGAQHATMPPRGLPGRPFQVERTVVDDRQLSQGDHIGHNCKSFSQRLLAFCDHDIHCTMGPHFNDPTSV